MKDVRVQFSLDGRGVEVPTPASLMIRTDDESWV